MPEPKRSCLSDGSPICTFGAHVIADEEYFYCVNPLGGYGRDEVLCCDTCIRKPENKEIRRRLIECAGVTELEDK